MKHLVLAILATLVVAVPAQAAVPWTAAEQTKAIAVADAHWPNSKCFGTGHDLEWLSGASLAGSEIAIGLLGGCQVLVQTDRMVSFTESYSQATPAVWLCTVLEHEFGHNAGMDHVDDPHNVMNGTLLYPADDCVSAFADPNWVSPVAAKPAVKAKPRHKKRHRRHHVRKTHR